MSSATALSAFPPGSASISNARYARPAPPRARATEPARVSSVSRLVVQAPSRDWREEVQNKLQDLIRLPVGWDGYRGQPVSFETANFAVRMLESILPSGAPAPQVIPGVSGDVQIEWHTEAGDIELHVRRPNSVHAWRETDATGEDGEEVELTFDFRPIVSWIKQISEATADADTAAA
ncbi:MAG: hypothetical protein O9256_02010 [Rhizobiaceae bacterium]|nr:hypothetical protein [Rhizobiaceae bacterium]MCZ8349857.1 hypothetical protein [Rhizobium sp.]